MTGRIREPGAFPLNIERRQTAPVRLKLSNTLILDPSRQARLGQVDEDVLAPNTQINHFFWALQLL